ncbi:MAG: hypothetical protein ACOX86_06555 [Pelotomaculaceae bacterium]
MWGPPGVGKFSIVKQIAAESGWGSSTCGFCC